MQLLCMGGECSLDMGAECVHSMERLLAAAIAMTVSMVTAESMGQEDSVANAAAAAGEEWTEATAAVFM